MQRILPLLMSLIAGVWFATSPALAGTPDEVTGGGCPGLPTNAQLQHFLQQAARGQEISGSLGPNTAAGGLFQGERMWGAVVNRDGRLCAFITSTPDSTQVWPGSQAIAKAKAFTANGFSLDDFVLSTARLYTFALPGHSLFGLNQSNTFNPLYLVPPGGAGGLGLKAGGIITFGGGRPAIRGRQDRRRARREWGHGLYGSRNRQARPRPRRAQPARGAVGGRHCLRAHEHLRPPALY